MRIAVIQDYLRMGGTESQAISLSRYWQEQGEEVVLITYRPGGALEARLRESPELHRIALQQKDRCLNWYAPRLADVLKEWIPDAMVFFGRNGHRYASLLGRRIPQAATVATFRTRRFLPLAYRRALRETDRVIANSEAGANRLLTEGLVSREKLRVVRNGLLRPVPRKGELHALRTRVRTRMGLSEETRLFLYLGSFVPGKRVGWLIDALAPLAGDWRLVLVGDGKGRIGLERKWRIHPKIHFMGASETPEEYLAAADLMVTASMEEGLPNALIEAQAWGLAVVAFDIEGVKETMLPGQTGELLQPKDGAAAFRSAVEHWGWHASEGGVVAEFAGSFIQKRFGAEERAKEMLEFIREAVGEKRNGFAQG
ncbi:MAG: glycosyltransferase family 4 protein [Puniceicoccaceae bacterium]